MRCTWRRFGSCGRQRLRDRCCTVAPAWASPSTPTPSTSRMASAFSLCRRWRGLRLTATTMAPISAEHGTRPPVARMSRRVALATAQHLPDLDPDSRLLLPHLEEEGVSAEPAIWNDPAVDWAAYDVVVIRS